ncbi:TonB-dependent receptor [Sediminitomix flava]|uniref:Outer membrane receptor protein involved in Fe transport n=1 Tax=Sediminitomix flava TaxID=379075 RepID=A0A315ZCL4_SEDFL|nr:TonB-dependent receptor [Sediminitomix flava]PWJ43281.1 outer membrane receptor protein involved in Fe transport [Sediminitomix flava]
MTKLLLLLTFLLTNTYLVFAQYTIKGNVKSEKGESLPYSNIILHPKDSKKIEGSAVSDDNGVYQITNIEKGEYWMEVVTLGYTSFSTDPFLLDTDKVLDFKLAEDVEVLEEVAVKATVNNIRETAGKLVVDLASSSLVNTNLQDVMKKIPGVIMMNGRLSYGGQQGIRILINGKSTNYMDTESLLQDFPAENIEKVELIQNPGAEFEAEGSGPIINVILKKNAKFGTHGNVKLNLGYDNQEEYGSSFAIGGLKNKINWQFNSGYRRSSWLDDLEIERTVKDDIYTQKTYSPYYPQYARMGGSLDYYLNKFHTVGLSSRLRHSDSERINENRTTISEAEQKNELLTNTRYDNNSTVFNVNPYYQFEKDKHSINFDLNYVSYANFNNSTLFEVGGEGIPFDDLNYEQDGTYQIVTAKGDYKWTKNDNLTFYAGSKYDVVETGSDLKTYVSENNEFIFDEAQSNLFTINEEIFALYSKIDAKYKDWDFSGGLRWEYSETKGVSQNTETQSKPRIISKLFPSMSIGRKLSKHFGTNLNYNYRISRPPYSSLNTFVYYYDPYTSEQGNPNIIPQYTNSLQFSLTYDEQPFFSVGYKETSDHLFEYISQDDETGQISRALINIDHYNNWNIRAFAPLSFHKKMDGYTGFIVNYNEYLDDQLTPILDLSKWSLTWYTSLEYELPWDIHSELSAYYVTGGLEGQIEHDWIADISFALSKSFAENKYKVYLGINDILNRTFNGTINSNQINGRLVNDWSRQNVYMSLTYNFGSDFKKKGRRRNSSQDIENRIKSNN